jgi:ABC-2 type transport system permease protein
VSAPGTLAWFARHECRLAWRDWLAMITAGRRRRSRTIVIAFAVFAALMHLLAYAMVGRFAGIGPDADRATLVVITGCLLLSCSLMVSQAMECTTRAFYARSDLQLILSSPADAARVYSVRIGAMALSIVMMALLLAAPFIDVLALLGGPRWLCAYGVVVAMGLSATALGVVLTIALFRTIGPRRARLAAQIMAAIVGAAFVIGLQLGAILSDGTLSRIDFLTSQALVAHAPDPGSMLYVPAVALTGDAIALAAVVAAAFVLLCGVILIFAPRLSDYSIIATDASRVPAHLHRASQRFHLRAPRCALRQKEWKLLLRDPWLVSQSLMQILYLLPPAVLLWHGFGGGPNASVLVVPVLVMAAGQLAGGLGWIAISGEDAPDLVASAPVRACEIVRAKFEAVLGAIGAVFGLFLVALALVSAGDAAVAALGIAVASAAAMQIQLWFRSQARRGDFRRRQISSRTATFAEAFSSISWAATAALAAMGTWLALITAAIAAGILGGAWLISPAHAHVRERAWRRVPATRS